MNNDNLTMCIRCQKNNEVKIGILESIKIINNHFNAKINPYGKLDVYYGILDDIKINKQHTFNELNNAIKNFKNNSALWKFLNE